MPQNNDEQAVVTAELLALEEEFGSEMSSLRQKQEAALKRLKTAVDEVKAEKLAERLKKSAD